MHRIVSVLLCLAAVVPGSNPLGAQDVRKLTGIRFSYPTYAGPDSILYESMAAGNWDVYRIPSSGMDDGGSAIVRLTYSKSLDRMPTLSPDVKYIAFISDRGGNYDVWRMDADGQNPVRLTDSAEPEIHPYWTPDSRRIVYNRRVPGERLYAIRIIDLDGEGDRELLNDGELNSYAQVSPDGTKLVFDKWWDNVETNGEIMVMDLSSRVITRLTDNDVYDGYPTWFPDSRHVLYSSEVNGVFKLFRLNTETGEREQLTFGSGNDQRGDVAHDGSRIVFNRNVNNSIEIYELMLPNGR